jgi:hypothetical protein
MGQMTWDQFLAGATDLSLLQNIETTSGAQPDSYSMAAGGSFLGVKWLWKAVDSSSPSNVKVENGTVPPLFHIPSWHAQGQFYLYLQQDSSTSNSSNSCNMC